MDGLVDTLAPVAPVALGEVKAFLRLSGDEDDALLAGFVRTATELCEAFTGQWLVARAATQTLGTGAGWRRLGARPVRLIAGVDADGGPLAGWAYEVDIDAAGDGWVRIINAGPSTTVSVRYTAGLGSDWNASPEALRQGIVRLVAHLHAHRDAPDALGPPAAVAALWRPFRRIRLGN